MTIAVIGAGIAGLTAARLLQERGHDVVVFDKGRAPGGRVATRRVLDGEAARPELTSLAFDYGAQYFTVREPRFEREVEAWVRARVAQVWHGALAAFDSEGRQPVDDETMRFVGTPGMSAIPRHLARGLDLRSSTTVALLERDGPDASGGGRWRVGLTGGVAAGSFDRVIVAVPAPEAVSLLAGLPALSHAAAGVVMRPCWAVLVAFDARVPTAFDAAFVGASPLGWIARDRSKPKRGLAETWVLHATTSWSDAHADDRPDAVGPFLLNAFADLVRGAVPLPVYLSSYRWRHASADPPLARGAIAADDRSLVLCGDWCAGNRMEGAFLSGVTAADELSD